jgi:hypothetical protein
MLLPQSSLDLRQIFPIWVGIWGKTHVQPGFFGECRKPEYCAPVAEAMGQHT